MIAKLKGTVDAIDGDSAVIDVNGVGYLVSASARTLRDLVVAEPPTTKKEGTTAFLEKRAPRFQGR